MTTKDLRNNIEKVLGNNIRCLLPSYWWKRLFHQVADTIDTINGVEIVGSEAKLKKLDAQQGSLASVATRKEMKISECYFPTEEDESLSDAELFAKLTPLKAIKVNFPLPDLSSADTALRLVSEDLKNLGFLMLGKGLCTAIFTDVAAGTQKYWILTGQFIVDAVNNYLKEKKFYILDDREDIGEENMALFDQIFTIVDSNTDVYVKGMSWERLVKEGESGKQGEGDTRIPSYLLYYPYTTRNDVYTMHESFIEHNATELPKIKNSINNKEGYILNVVAAGTSATDVQTMQDVDFHYLGYGTGNTGGLVVITSQFIPIYRAVQPNRLFLGFKEDGSCEVKEIAVGDTLYLYYSEDYGFNFTDAEKAANAENIIPIWNSLDESFTPRPIIIRHKVNNTPSGSGNYLSIPAVLTGVDTTGMNITLVGCYSPGRFLEYQYNRTTGEFVSLKEITIEGGEGSYDDTGIKKDIADLQAKDTQYDAKLAELSAETEVLKEAQQFTDVAVKDLQDMKIDRENDDYYPKMAVGLADNLAGVDVVDSEINFRRSGGGAITDGVARIESIKGNSVVWNQLAFKNAKSTTMNGVTFTANPDGSITANGTASATAYILINPNFYTDASHKYAVFGTPNGGSATTYYFGDGNTLNDRDGNGTIANGGDRSSNFACRVQSGNTVTNIVYRPRLIDLTQMFGAGNEPTTIEEFYQRIPMGVDLNAYNEGEVIHMDVQSIESVGVNQWDEEWELGRVHPDTGTLIVSTKDIRSKNFIRVIPGNDYYFIGSSQYYVVYYDKDYQHVDWWSISPYRVLTIPNNVHYVKLSRLEVTTYKGDICINLSDTSINGKYFPYIKRVEDLSIIRKYFPQGMKSAGTAHDEIRYNKASGKWEKVVRIGEVDLGTLNWDYVGASDSTYSMISDSLKALIKPPQTNADKANVLCVKFVTDTADGVYSRKNKESIGLSYTGRITIYAEGYTSTSSPASFKAAMQGVILYYELAEPIVTELDEADQFKDLDYQVWNDGTEKANAEGKSAPLAADITYGFNAIGKIKELESLVAALRAKVGI